MECRQVIDGEASCRFCGGPAEWRHVHLSMCDWCHDEMHNHLDEAEEMELTEDVDMSEVKF